MGDFMVNGHENSLIPKFHSPLSPHPNAHSNAHSQTEIKWIADCCRCNPNFGPLEIYSRLLIQKSLIPVPIMAFTDVLSVLINIFFITKRKSAFYHTPDRIGYKMQFRC